MTTKKIQWHPAFASAIQLEFKPYEEYLEYKIEHELTQKPLKIDVVIIKKVKDVSIDKPMGKILGKYNIFEYKSPTDYLSVDDYYKVKAYAYLYKVVSEGTNDISLKELTINLTSTKFPRKLVEYLNENNMSVIKAYNGIYYIQGTDIQTQLIVIKELDSEDALYLKLLQQQHEDLKILDIWLREYISHIKDPMYGTIMNVLSQSIPNQIMEVYSKMPVEKLNEKNIKFLLDTIEELSLDKVIKEEGIKEGIKEGMYTVAKRLLMKGTDIQTIIDITDLSKDEIEKLIQTMQGDKIE